MEMVTIAKRIILFVAIFISIAAFGKAPDTNAPIKVANTEVPSVYVSKVFCSLPVGQKIGEIYDGLLKTYQGDLNFEPIEDATVDDFRKKVQEIFIDAGYPKEEKSKYYVKGEITKLNLKVFGQFAGNRVRSVLTIKWSLFESESNREINTYEKEGYGTDDLQSGKAFPKAICSSANNLLADPAFVSLLKRLNTNASRITSKRDDLITEIKSKISIADVNEPSNKSDNGSLFVFRGKKWGSLKSEILASEESKIFEDKGDVLIYNGSVSNFNTLICYYFANEKLVKGRYIIVVEHTNKNDFIDDYDKLKSSLIEKYGKPLLDEAIWRNGLYRNDRAHYGLAVSIGHLAYRSQWEKPDTQVDICLSGDNYQLTLMIEYKSLLHQDLIDEHEKNKHLEGL